MVLCSWGLRYVFFNIYTIVLGIQGINQLQYYNVINFQGQ